MLAGDGNLHEIDVEQEDIWAGQVPEYERDIQELKQYDPVWEECAKQMRKVETDFDSDDMAVDEISED